MSIKMKWMMVIAVLVVMLGVGLFVVMQADLLASADLPGSVSGCVVSTCTTSG